MLGKFPVFSERMCGHFGVTSVPDNELEETSCKIVDEVRVKFNDIDVEFCHRVGSQLNSVTGKTLPTVNES